VDERIRAPYENISASHGTSEIPGHGSKSAVAPGMKKNFGEIWRRAEKGIDHQREITILILSTKAASTPGRETIKGLCMRER
jgi:hypothetical protein